MITAKTDSPRNAEGRPTPAPGRRGRPPRRELGDALHLGGLRTLLALGHLELHPLVVVQAAVTRTCDFAVVDEQVAAAVIRGDEAVALFAVEPLDRALRHAYSTENPPRNIGAFVAAGATREVRGARSTSPRAKARTRTATAGTTVAGEQASSTGESRTR